MPARTVQEYFQVLEDTLIGTTLRPNKYKTDRKLTTKPKFYFFDMGIVNSLKRIQSLASETEPYAECFEQFTFNEIKAYLSYNNKLYDNETIQF